MKLDGKLKQILLHPNSLTLFRIFSVPIIVLLMIYPNRLFTAAAPGRNWRESLNPDSLVECEAILEPSLSECGSEHPVQFERLGYFSVDSDSTPERRVFNEIVSLKDTWKKIQGGKRWNHSALRSATVTGESSGLNSGWTPDWKYPRVRRPASWAVSTAKFSNSERVGFMVRGVLPDSV